MHQFQAFRVLLRRRPTSYVRTNVTVQRVATPAFHSGSRLSPEPEAPRQSSATHTVTKSVGVVSAIPSADNSSIDVEFNDGGAAKFSALWLRDNCLQFATASHRDYAIPGAHDAFAKAALRRDGAVAVEWGDAHFSVFPPDYLRKWCQATVQQGQALRPPVVSKTNPVPEVDYDALSSDPATLLRAMKSVNDVGVVIVRDCPLELAPMGPSNLLASPTPRSLLDIMAKFAEVPAYIPLYGYGSDYLLGAEKNETQRNCPQCFCNIPKPIEMHQDFAYFNDVPGLFYNFCMRVDDGIVGGSNTCMDAFHVAEMLRRDDRASFDALAEIQVTFAKTAMNSERPVMSSVDRSIIRLDADGEISDITWSLMYLRTQRLDGPTLARFARAREAWKAAIARAAAQGYEVSTPMGPGDCTILNNKRMMHAREPFVSVDGVRQFYQTYGQEGLFLNRLKVLEKQVGGTDVFHVHRDGSAIPVMP